MTASLAWLLLAGPAWAAVGGVAIPRRYRRLGRDPRLAPLAGGLAGAATGPVGVGYLWLVSPPLGRARHLLLPTLLLAGELLVMARLLAPADPCLTSLGYVLDQAQNGLTLGAIYATMAIGLTLIFSVFGVVSFSHGQFVMLGGVASYLLLTTVLPFNALLVVPLVGLGGFGLGALIELTLLAPIRQGRVQRPDEYAILVTFGLGIFAEYALLALLGPVSGLSAPRYTDRPPLALLSATYAFGPLHLRTDLIVAGAAGLIVIGLLHWFLRRTWAGRSLRGVAMDPQAAAVAGIDSARVFTLAFGLGSALASMAGALLIPVIAFTVLDTPAQAAVRSYVIVVLGGLGSVPGAGLGGLFIGVVEALGAACYPDPSRGAVYQDTFGLALFAAVLLLRPQGFFGRRNR